MVCRLYTTWYCPLVYACVCFCELLRLLCIICTCVLIQHQYEEVNTVVMESCVKTLAVSLGTLTQLVTNFCQSYEAELQPWVGHRHPPTLGPLGPLCKRTAAHWNHISKVLFTDCTSLQTMTLKICHGCLYQTPTQAARVLSNVYAFLALPYHTHAPHLPGTELWVAGQTLADVGRPAYVAPVMLRHFHSIKGIFYPHSWGLLLD